MQNLQIYKNDQFGEIRTITIDNEPWFVGKNVADALGYENTRDALSRHVDPDDKNTVVIHDGIQGNPNKTIINESGLYSLILSSKLEKAKQFKRWVTSEVLPSIRKTGTYSVRKSDKQLDIQEMNAKTRYANMFLKLSNVDTLSKEYKNILVSKATEVLTGVQLIPLPRSEQKGYSATAIGKMFGVSARQIGTISKANDLKTDEYGEWYRSKSEYSPKEVDTFVYNDKAVEEFRRILEVAV